MTPHAALAAFYNTAELNDTILNFNADAVRDNIRLPDDLTHNIA
jgi:hypothetical protein